MNHSPRDPGLPDEYHDGQTEHEPPVHDDGGYHEERGEEMDIGAVSGNLTCYNCGGWGHVSKDCPSQKKGKCKGEPDKGKGKGKGFEKGQKGRSKGKGREKGEETKGKGKGKGYERRAGDAARWAIRPGSANRSRSAASRRRAARRTRAERRTCTS